MIVCQGWKSPPQSVRNSVLAIGNFDGVHRGHQVLIGQTVETARKAGCPAGAMVFEPHPREYFHPLEVHFRLTPLEDKLAILETLKLDFAVVATFDAELAAMEFFEFTDKVLVEALAVRHVIIGYDFYYGRNRRGSPETMILTGIEHDFEVTVVPPMAEDGEVFSSTTVRLKLAQGDVAGAAKDLGRNWRVRGKVISGAKRGTGLGYPTANMQLPRGTTLAHGIYAVQVTANGSRVAGAAYLGTRPTFDDGAPVLEIFLIDFDGDLYGREIAVDFVQFIRPDRKFDSADELVRQMDDDIANVRAILAAAP
jgi:riboflavin kinase/FMN adenylyltransferase